ncbi:MAG: hypothetical protein A2758_01875 [Candidatus Zambryskibacteria bacterium RIFCSPHIGHO2_01_FULL_49_18]|uniref:Uncharacterized protein n=2 Tax=Candidatus Zambryskiibacteriota TaxID=1817925 RepID=A0A1G2T3N9_9BACT|nr:MAG: hypothetical protein A2758_01875 [Candidatus Zambryskibacteria bacterium RIFCSPHIGHO2_01_FULL_49_18]OHB05119.1 MAG: hypothetical protein A3A26_00750 [Candidatus Zambryskibacteria bacterium RIFCSPLOWO2_01_FULL_47_14]
MRTYLSTLHKRSPAHKKRFAMLTSGGFTLLIFAVWAMVTFPPSGLADPTAQMSGGNVAKVNDANPFGSLMRGLEASFENLKESFGELKNNTLNIYDRPR